MKKPNTAPQTDGPKKISNPQGKVVIHQVKTGVRGLDAILGGGIPEFSFNIIAGTPGCGKTTLAHQILFANATEQKPALYFTVLGEPAIKMLRYQQQYAFFDGSKLGKAIRFINLSDVLLQSDMDAVLEEIARQVAALSPSLVVVDSFRTVLRKAAGTATESDLQSFVQRLAQFLTGWEATTFLVGEYVPDEMRDNPVFTVADGLIWLSQVTERIPLSASCKSSSSVVRRRCRVCILFGSARKVCRLSPELWDWSARRCSQRRGRGFPRASLSWIRCWAGACWKATACSSRVRRARASRRWPRSSLPKVCASGSLASLPSLKSARMVTRSARPVLASISRHRRCKEIWKSSTCVRWTFQWMKRCRNSSKPSRAWAPSGW